MTNRTYYVFCEDNCKFEGMTKEQIYDAIAEATGATPTPVDEAFITKLKEQNANHNLKMWKGTQAQYNALATHDNDTLYIIDTNKVKEPDAIRPITLGGTGASTASSALFNFGIADYITEDNDYGDWHYRKWASGRAECWCSHQFLSVSMSSAGSLYRGTLAQIDFPASLFADVPNILYSIDGGWDGWLAKSASNAMTAAKTPELYLYRATTGTPSVDVFFFAEGYWQ